MIQIIFAVLAGILTVAAPCILPMLPILLGASVGQTSRQRPLLIVAGFIVSFSAASLLLSATIQSLGLSPNLVRDIAVLFLALFGAFMIWPKPFEILSQTLSDPINKANQFGSGQGNLSGLFLGLVLGIIWTPCAGPILGAILALIATQGTTGRSVILLTAYAFGAGIPMLIIAYGSQWLTGKVRAIAKYSVRLQQIFGVLVLLLAVAMFFQYDTKIQAQLVSNFPQFNLENTLVEGGNPVMPNSIPDVQPASPLYNAAKAPMPNTANAMNIDFKNYGQAPDFIGVSHWLNSGPLTIQSLKGKVVLVDFWTYSCINCIRTLPFVTKWYNAYKDQGLVVVGVHTPEFGFEKDTNNVADAIKRFGINYPVAQDNDYGTWTAYNNQYWPAEYLIDQTGKIVYEHFGEGEYDRTEDAIRQLLGIAVLMAPNNGQNLSQVNSPEMYFGTDRLEYLTPEQYPSAAGQAYGLPKNLSLNNFAMEGNWQFKNDHAVLMAPSGKIQLRFSSGKLYMVADSQNSPITLKITVDGQSQPDVVVSSSELYTLFDSQNYAEHNAVIEIPDAGFEAFTFTFG